MGDQVFALFILLTSLCSTTAGIYFTNDAVLWTHRKNSISWTSDMPGSGNGSENLSLRTFFFQMKDLVIIDLSYSYSMSQLLHVDTSGSLVITDTARNISTHFHIGNSPNLGQIAVDWISSNVYWTDQGFRWIAMKALPTDITKINSLDQGFKVVAEKYVDKPTGLALYPRKFFLFWADEGKTPKIERSSLEGTDRTVIVWKSVLRPTSLTIDMTNDILYWTDPARYTIESCKLDGGQRSILAYEQGSDYYGVAVFKEYVLFTIPSKMIAGNYNRDTGGSIHLTGFPDSVFDVTVYSASVQSRESKESCDTNLTDVTCEQICIQTSKHQYGGFDCFCDDAYELQDDGKSCGRNILPERSLLFTNGNKICHIPLNAINSPAFFNASCNVIVHDKNITKFVLDMERDFILFTDGSNIYLQQPFSNNTLLKLSSDNGTYIKDITFDWRDNGRVYWTKNGDGDIYFTDVETEPSSENRMRLGDNNITYLAVDPHSRLLFYIRDDGEHATLRAKNIDTNDDPFTMNAPNLKRPTDLELDWSNNRLVWNDKSGFLVSMNVNGTDERKQSYSTIAELQGLDFELAIVGYKNYVITTSSVPGNITIFYQYTPKIITAMKINNMPTPILDMHIFDTTIQPNVREPCEVDNGGCDHVCLPEEISSNMCRCHYGYHLQSDGKTCSSEYTGSDDYIFVHDAEHGFLRIDTATQEAYTLKIDVRVTSPMTFDQKRKELLWVDTANKNLKRKHLDQDQAIIFGESFTGNATLAVDSTTGNIYFSDGHKLSVVSRDDSVKTLIEEDRIIGDIKKITLFPVAGEMAWIEINPSRVVKAKMDGTKVLHVEFISTKSTAPDDLVYDVTATDPVLYYCYSENDTIYRQNDILYQKGGYKPVVLDVTENFVFFLPRDLRKIIRISKTDGSGEHVVFESPLSLVLVGLYVSKPAPENHAHCAECNGGCSTLCLPTSVDTWTCECASNDGSARNGICGKVAVCDDIPDVDGLTLEMCCSNLPNAECRPSCSEGYTQERDILKCEKGKWNYSPDSICQANESGENNKYIYIGAAVGAVVIVVIAIVVVYCWRKKASKRNGSGRSRLPSIADLNNGLPQREYATADTVISPVPPPRLSQAEEADGGVYTELDEVAMKNEDKLVVGLPPEQRRGSSSEERRNRYSGFPHMDHEYLDLRNTDMASLQQFGKNSTYYHGYLTPVDGRRDQRHNGKPGHGYKGNDNISFVPEEEDGYLSNFSSHGSNGSQLHSGSGSGSGAWIRDLRDKDLQEGHSSGVGHPVSVQYSRIPLPHAAGWHGTESDYLRFVNRT